VSVPLEIPGWSYDGDIRKTTIQVVFPVSQDTRIELD